MQQICHLLGKGTKLPEVQHSSLPVNTYIKLAQGFDFLSLAKEPNQLTHPDSYKPHLNVATPFTPLSLCRKTLIRQTEDNCRPYSQ